MPPKQVKQENQKKKIGLPLKKPVREPPVTSDPTSSGKQNSTTSKGDDHESGRRKCLKYIYDKENNTCLGRTFKNWVYIILYSIIYLIFLSTYTMIFLYATLAALKYTKDYTNVDKVELLTYSAHGIGLSATPTSENMYPLIWYKIGKEDTYQKYVNAIDQSLKRTNSSDIFSYLGPCSRTPYGYGSEPCVIIRINKQFNWAAKPLRTNSSEFIKAPIEVKEWVKSSQKLWLHCSGYHSYDREHIRKIKYYPYPPGFDPNIFPLDVRDKSPLVSLQISDFTLGISLAIQCNLWYEHGPSSVEFVLYVE